MDSNDAEIRRLMQQLRQMQGFLTQTSVNQRDISKLMEIFQHPQHRILKLNTYPLLKTCAAENLESLQIDFNTDPELQLVQLKLLCCLSAEQALQQLKTNDSVILKLLSEKPEFHYERLAALQTLFLKITAIESQLDLNDSLVAGRFYQKIAENCLVQDREIAANSILCLCNLFLIHYQQVIQNPNNLVYVDLTQLILQIQTFLAPRILLLQDKILSYETRIRAKMIILLPVLLSCILKNYENNLNLHFLKCEQLKLRTINTVQENSNTQVSSINVRDYYSILLKHLIDGILKSSYEIDVMSHTYQAIFILLQISRSNQNLIGYTEKNRVIWELFDHIHQFIQKVNYRKEINYILLNIVSFVSQTNPISNITISMRILEIVSNNVNVLLTRFLFMLICFHNIINSSIHMMQQSKQSSILGLFSQSWFLNKIVQEESMPPEEMNNNNYLTCMKEELLITLIVAGLQYKRTCCEQKKNQFNKVLMEILDVTYRMINWKASSQSKLAQLSIEMYLLLLEECTKVIGIEQLGGRFQELISRINSNEINFIPKIKTLAMLSVKYDEKSLLPAGKIDYLQALAEFRNFMIQPIQQNHIFILNNKNDQQQYQQQVTKHINLLQIVYQTLYYLNQNYHSNENCLKQNILELLSDYNDNLQEVIKSKQMNHSGVNSILDFNRQLSQLIMHGDVVDREQLKIKIDLSEGHEEINDKEPRDILQLGYNIFLKGFIDNKILLQQNFYEQEQAIYNLKSLNSYLQPKENFPNIYYSLEQNCRIITGVCDFVQIYCSHVVDIQNSQLCIGIKVINLSPFMLNNLSVKILLDYNTSLLMSNKNSETIDELCSYQIRNLFYIIKIDKYVSLSFAFDIMLNDIKVEQQSFSIRTQNYRVSLLEFIIPNYFSQLSAQSFYSVWNELDYLQHTKCILQGGANTIISQKNMGFNIVLLDENFDRSLSSIMSEKRNLLLNIGLLGYLMDGGMIAITISNVPLLEQKCIVTVEIKSTTISCIETFRNEMEQLLEEIQLTVIMN